jgi:hypothetical protein
MRPASMPMAGLASRICDRSRCCALYIKNQKIHKMDIEIRLLTKDLKDDYLFFFDNIIFQEKS